MRLRLGRRLIAERLEGRRLLAADWTNASNPLDVNTSGFVSALDVLIVANEINSGGVRALPAKTDDIGGPLVDVNADGLVSALDPLLIVNALNEFTQPMSLSLDLEASESIISSGEGMDATVFEGRTLPRTSVRLEEVTDGIAAVRMNRVADSAGQFEFEIDPADTTTFYRIVATDVLGRSEQSEFTVEAGEVTGSTTARLTLHFPVGIGSLAPDVSLLNQDGETVELATLLEESAVVLYFYPKDNTPGCSIEAQDFRDRKAEIEALGAKIVGVSIDPVESHQEFSDQYSLSFDILSDIDREVSAAYGVLGEFNGTPIAKRTTFIIGQDGYIKEVFKDVRVQAHGEQVISALQSGIAG